jgi:hypothetical protein
MTIFPSGNALPLTGDLAVVLLAEDMDRIFYLEESLKAETALLSPD